MALIKLYQSPEGETPSIIIYRNKPDQIFIQFMEEGMAINDYTVDDIHLHNNDLYRVHDFGRNVDNLPTQAQIDAFNKAREIVL